MPGRFSAPVQALAAPLAAVQAQPSADYPAPALASALAEQVAVQSAARAVALARSTEGKPQDKPLVEQPKPSLRRRPRASQQADEDADTPLGDWQTEGNNGLVRIEACGAALCGFVLDAATHTKGETVLINMKPKNDTEWTGNVYSRSSGNSYYGTMTLKDGNTLRVEACALGSFFCSGNNWTRLRGQPVSPGRAW